MFWFLVTVCSTFFAGMQLSDRYARLVGTRHLLGFDFSAAMPAWHSFGGIWVEAAAFSASLLGILFAHEMGHYLTARRFGVDVSPPYFIPSVPPFGTFGAFIRLHVTKIPVGRLMKIAAYGPFAGMIVAVPVLIVGLLLSDVRPLPQDMSSVSTFGSCLLMKGVEAIVFPSVPEGHDIFLHPVAFAGWAGCFVTALNLIPIGQLDGGHVAYALFGESYARVVKFVWLGMLALGVFYLGWLILGLILYRLIGIKHPPMCDDGVAVGHERRIGIAAALLFVLTFAPVPVKGASLPLIVGDIIDAIRLL